MKKNKIAVIGCGNMGDALVQGVIKNMKIAPSRIMVSDIKKQNLNKLKKNLKVKTTQSNVEAAKGTNIIILAVKPQNMAAVLGQLAGKVTSKQLIVSIAAGISTKFIESKLRAKVSVIRTMPNTPLQVGKGITALYKGRYASERQLTIARSLFSCMGKTIEVKKESLIDAVTAVSGSGPAYVYLFIESLVNAGMKLGLSSRDTEVLVKETIQGSVELLDRSKKSPKELRLEVTSPEGTTEAALKVFNKRGFEKIVEQAVRAACKRSKVLSK